MEPFVRDSVAPPSSRRDARLARGARRRLSRVAQVAAASVLAVTAAGCPTMPGGDASIDAAAPSPQVAFHGEQEAFPGFSYDTQYQPAAQPVQVRAVITATGGATADARAVASGSSSAPALTGYAGSGRFALDAHFRFEIWLKIDLRVGIQTIHYEGRVMNAMIPSIDLAFGGQTMFDPFLVGGMATAHAVIPDTMVLTVPLAQLAGIPPGVTGNLVVNVAGTIDTTFTGVCAAISEDGTARYTGQTSTTGQLLLHPRVDLAVASLNRTVGPFEVPVPVEIGPRPLDLGTRMATFGPDSAAAMAGGSMAQRGTCGDAADGGLPPDASPPGTDANAMDAPPPLDAPGTDASGAEAGGCATDGGACMTAAECCSGFDCVAGACVPAASPTCAAGCAGCCAGGTCMAGNTASACGTGGVACTSCPTSQVCNSFGLCDIDPTARFNLRIVSGTVPVTNPSGGAWDPFGGLPDPYVSVTNGSLSAQTPNISDTITPTWNAITLRGVTAAALRGTATRMQVLDADTVGDDSIGTCSFYIPATAFASGFPIQSATGCSGGVTLRYQLQP